MISDNEHDRQRSIFIKKLSQVNQKAEQKGYSKTFAPLLYIIHYAKVKILDLLARLCPIPGLREELYRIMGVKIAKGTFVDRDVYFDTMWPELISIGKGCGIVSGCVLLTHQRDFSKYYIGSRVHDLDYIVKPITIGDNVSIGTGTIILPGIVIGNGAIISAGSVVRKNVDPYTLVAGNPAKLITRFRYKK
jgi:acetyltransferase-like isoleucine patch superfamily enzyme